MSKVRIEDYLEDDDYPVRPVPKKKTEDWKKQRKKVKIKKMKDWIVGSFSYIYN